MKTLRGLIAREDGAARPGTIDFDRRIKALRDVTSAGDDYILPGLIDLQVNGSHGISVMGASAEQIGSLARQMAREGTTGFLPTAITSPIGQIERAHDAIDLAITAEQGDGSDPAAAILGMHLEGPFISAARLGAHPHLNTEPRGEILERVIAMRRLCLITLAPELPGALDAIASFCVRGVVVSLGHSEASLEQARAAIGAGARMFTHLFNAMRPLHHRDPGLIAAALSPCEALAATIPDGIHVHPAMLALAWRARGPRGIILTTDKVALAGVKTGRPGPMGGAGVQIKGGVARLADGTIAGAVISMLDGVRLMVEKVGLSIGEAALAASSNPARLLGLADRGRIAIGARADLLVLGRDLKLKSVFIGGRELL